MDLKLEKRTIHQGVSLYEEEGCSPSSESDFCGLISRRWDETSVHINITYGKF